MESTNISLLSLLHDLKEQSSSQVDYLHKVCESLGINVTIENALIARILLSRNRATCNLAVELVGQCNGVIISLDTCQALAIPPRAFHPNPNFKTVASNYSCYKVYRAFDGTVVTLYYYMDRWHISTTNMYSVGDLKWIGDKTWQELLDESLAKYPEFSYDKLNKDYCYTIGFRNTNVHPLETDENAVWFIQAVNLQTHEILLDELKELPHQCAMSRPPKFKDLLRLNKESLDTYSKTRSKHYYGYILRAPFATVRENSDIFLESLLMKKVRQIIYNIPHMNANLTCDNRLDYVTLRAYLDYNNKQLAINLFPQFATRWKQYDKIFESTTKKIIERYRCRAPKLTSENQEVRDPIDECSNAFCNIYFDSNKDNISPYDNESKHIINDMIIDLKYLGLYFSICKDTIYK